RQEAVKPDCPFVETATRHESSHEHLPILRVAMWRAKDTLRGWGLIGHWTANAATVQSAPVGRVSDGPLRCASHPRPRIAKETQCDPSTQHACGPSSHPGSSGCQGGNLEAGYGA